MAENIWGNQCCISFDKVGIKMFLRVLLDSQDLLEELGLQDLL